MNKLLWLFLSLVLVGCGGVEEVVPVPTEAMPVEVTARPTPTAPSIPTVAVTKETATEETTAADADVLFVKATETAPNTWSFSVTVAHPDTGWEDYTDGWDVVLPDGTVLLPNPDSPFTRLLLHPHENEQPFTRSQSNIAIPADITQVTVRAHDIVDGFGGQELVVDLTAVSTDQFDIIRFKP